MQLFDKFNILRVTALNNGEMSLILFFANDRASTLFSIEHTLIFVI